MPSPNNFPNKIELILIEGENILTRYSVLEVPRLKVGSFIVRKGRPMIVTKIAHALDMDDWVDIYYVTIKPSVSPKPITDRIELSSL